MRELNINEIKEVSGGWSWVVKALDWVGRASTASSIVQNFQSFSSASSGIRHQNIHPIAEAAGRKDE